jgi:hypothetical protein
MRYSSPMESDEENQTSPEAPYGWTMDPVTRQLRPKKRAGRKRTVEVADETNPAAHREALLTRQRRQQADFYERHPGYKEQYASQYQKDNPEKYSAYNRKSSLKLKREVMDHYGGRCACCGETELAFLAIDHIDGNGAEHRREIAAEKGSQWLQAGHNTYRWLRKNNYPEGFQVLCANCNCGKHWNGGVCPHEMAERPPSVPDERSDQVSDLA